MCVMYNYTDKDEETNNVGTTLAKNLSISEHTHSDLSGLFRRNNSGERLNLDALFVGEPPEQDEMLDMDEAVSFSGVVGVVRLGSRCLLATSGEGTVRYCGCCGGSTVSILK